MGYQKTKQKCHALETLTKHLSGVNKHIHLLRKFASETQVRLWVQRVNNPHIDAEVIMVFTQDQYPELQEFLLRLCLRYRRKIQRALKREING